MHIFIFGLSSLAIIIENFELLSQNGVNHISPLHTDLKNCFDMTEADQGLINDYVLFCFFRFQMLTFKTAARRTKIKRRKREKQMTMSISLKKNMLKSNNI